MNPIYIIYVISFISLCLSITAFVLSIKDSTQFFQNKSSMKTCVPPNTPYYYNAIYYNNISLPMYSSMASSLGIMSAIPLAFSKLPKPNTLITNINSVSNINNIVNYYPTSSINGYQSVNFINFDNFNIKVNKTFLIKIQYQLNLNGIVLPNGIDNYLVQLFGGGVTIVKNQIMDINLTYPIATANINPYKWSPNNNLCIDMIGIFHYEAPPTEEISSTTIRRNGIVLTQYTDSTLFSSKFYSNITIPMFYVDIVSI